MKQHRADIAALSFGVGEILEPFLLRWSCSSLQRRDLKSSRSWSASSIWMVDLWLETSENCEERASPLKLIVRMMQKFLSPPSSHPTFGWRPRWTLSTQQGYFGNFEDQFSTIPIDWLLSIDYIFLNFWKNNTIRTPDFQKFKSKYF